MVQATGRIVPADESEIHDEPHLEGRRITVLQIASKVEDGGLHPSAVAEQYDLPLGDVYRALTYYHDHPAEMEAVERTRREREESALESGEPTLGEIRDERE